MTSDEFFLKNSEKFDCIFIDGLHHYKQVKKDIENSISILNDKGIIFLHDCLPNSVEAQAVPRTEVHWNGDVWKAFVEVRCKPFLDCYTCYADYGIGVILKRKNITILCVVAPLVVPPQLVPSVDGLETFNRGIKIHLYIFKRGIVFSFCISRRV